MFHFLWWYRNRYRKKLVPEKNIGTGIGKIWYRKKSRNRYRKNLVPEKVPVSVSFNILGTVTHWSTPPTFCRLPGKGKVFHLTSHFLQQATIEPDGIKDRRACSKFSFVQLAFLEGALFFTSSSSSPSVFPGSQADSTVLTFSSAFITLPVSHQLPDGKVDSKQTGSCQPTA